MEGGSSLAGFSATEFSRTNAYIRMFFLRKSTRVGGGGRDAASLEIFLIPPRAPQRIARAMTTMRTIPAGAFAFEAGEDVRRDHGQ
jgi:hypothetical protein